MKKRIFILMFIFVFGLSGLVCSVVGSNAFASAGGTDNFIIRSYGDSIASGEGLDDHANYASGQSIICADSYPEVFSRNYLEAFGGQAVGYAVSGDKTGDLLEILAPYIDGSAQDMDAFNDTDIITLCIGANNVLLTAIDSIPDFLTGNMSEEEYQALLDDGVKQFKEDFPTILDTFAGKKVAVMTVYNPFKYLTLDDITVDSALSSFESTIRSVLSSFETRLQTMLSMSMDALQIINDDIRNSASVDVYVVDIWELFAGFSEEEYLTYINADMSKVVVDSSNLSSIMQGDISAVMSQFQTHCDPHPTKEGHAKIAEEHLTTFKYFKLSTAGDFSSLKDPNDAITLNISTFETGEYVYKLYKNIESESALFSQSSEKAIEIKASEIADVGNIFVEVYQDESLIFTTNAIEYEVNLNTFSISTDDSLMGIKDSGNQITIKFNATSMDGYTFKLIKSQGEQTTTLSEEGLGEYLIAVDDVLGKGSLYIEVYKNGEKITQTNSLSFDFTLNIFEISMDKDWSNVYLDPTESAVVSVVAIDYSNYDYKLYKSDANETNLLEEGTKTKYTITAQMLEGEGELYLEVYKNGEKLYTTDSIAYSVTINTFSITCEKSLVGIMEKTRTLEIVISAEYTEGYTYKLFKKVGEGVALLKESDETQILLVAEEIEGDGEIYLEVYKGEERVGTSNSIAFNVVIGNFTLVSSTDLQNVTDPNQEITILVNSGSVTNVEFKLMKETEEKAIALQTNKTGRFSLIGRQLVGSGRLYVEVYSGGELVSTTNALDYNITFVEGEGTSENNGNSGSVVIYISLALVGLTLIIGGVIVIVRMKKRNPF